jgi:hypothetical protein
VGRSYLIQYAEGLTGVGWKDVTNVVAGASNQVVTVPDAGAVGSGHRYYRLLIP